MPPEMKKPIATMNEMTCENCVFSYAYYTHKGKYPVCFNPESLDWERENEGVCSEGQWLFYREWLCEENTPNPEEKLYLCDYWELYTEFAREAKGNGKVMNKIKTEHECNLWVRENRVLCPFCMSGNFESIIWSVSEKDYGDRTVSGTFQCKKCGAILYLPTNELSSDIHIVTSIEHEDGTSQKVRL